MSTELTVKSDSWNSGEVFCIHYCFYCSICSENKHCYLINQGPFCYNTAKLCNQSKCTFCNRHLLTLHRQQRVWQVTCLISYHIISYHIISYHIIYHIIPYHIISYHISLIFIPWILQDYKTHMDISNRCNKYFDANYNSRTTWF
jgi:hypothetical protein